MYVCSSLCSSNSCSFCFIPIQLHVPLASFQLHIYLSSVFFLSTRSNLSTHSLFVKNNRVNYEIVIRKKYVQSNRLSVLFFIIDSLKFAIYLWTLKLTIWGCSTFLNPCQKFSVFLSKISQPVLFNCFTCNFPKPPHYFVFLVCS